MNKPGSARATLVHAYAIVTILFVGSTIYSQGKAPLPEDYPVSRADRFKGKPARPILDSKRARLYRTVLKQGAKQGPNFAGRYTVVTWGAGLGVFSMAVIDAKTGKVYFPPFMTVGNTAYGMPFVDKGENPAWSVKSKLIAFIGRPDTADKGMGLYIFSFDRGRFQFKYFEKEDENERKANQEAWEKELDRRSASMSAIHESFRKRLTGIYPKVWCDQGQGTRYPSPALEIICTEGDLIVLVEIESLPTPDEATERIRSELQFSNLPKWQPIDGLGEQGIETGKCDRSWIRFRKGTFYVWMNANPNREEKDDPACSNEQTDESTRLGDFSRRIAFVLAEAL